MNMQKLKGKIVENGMNYSDCAAAIGKSRQSFNAKVNGKSKFYVEEANKLAIVLKLSAEEKAEIFL